MPYLCRHIIIDLYGCPPALLDDLQTLEGALHAVVAAIGTEVMARASHQFTPAGASVMLVVGASHLSAHTWPEQGYAMVDIVVYPENFRVGDLVRLLRERLGARETSFTELRRGLVENH